ncbi:alpha/beta hydrolase [Winogradskyella eckloniae]|uniref:alpha/beta hydrolase n=1 Tax=Winogradskyella eckloniae TaxID=1089306 RepID=UPI0015677852|nr:alpha/beta hydrolase [Winogradskyella eckloniae]NRD21388.1 alpha/beta hydrolase [Winogradskyella eckloniae]
MKPIKLIFILWITMATCIACNSDSTDDNQQPEVLNPLEAYTELNVSYGSDSDQVFDLYLPANRSLSTKTLILVHGGGWSAGDKEDMDAFKDFILDQLPNYAIVNMNYRLADENNQAYPMQIDDITSVIDFMAENENYYTISDAIGFVGVSAGAHLSLLWSYGFDTEQQTEMVCSVVGPTNFTDPAYLENTNPILQALLNNLGIDTSVPYLEEISPYHRATSASPPTILFYGGEDPLVPTTQGTAMQSKLAELNVTHEFTLYPNEGHGWVGLNLLDTSLKLKAFIETHL